MLWFYVASLLFGGALLLPMVFGGLSDGSMELGDGDLDLDLGSDLDVGAEVTPTDVELVDAMGASDGAFDAVVDGLLSFRSLVFFTAFFGAGGLVVGAFGYGSVTTALTAVVIGAGAAIVNSTVFGLVTSGSTGSLISQRQYVGRIGKVIVPVRAGHRGRIRLDLGGQPQMLSAEPFDDRVDELFDAGVSVVVVEIERGIARITSLAEFGLGEEEA